MDRLTKQHLLENSRKRKRWTRRIGLALMFVAIVFALLAGCAAYFQANPVEYAAEVCTAIAFVAFVFGVLFLLASMGRPNLRGEDFNSLSLDGPIPPTPPFEPDIRE